MGFKTIMPSPKQDPRKIVEKLRRDRYSNAQAVYWGGSVAKGEGTEHSDLDVVVVVDHLPNAYRETFFIGGWPVDVFIHDLETLNYFFQESRNKSGIPGLLQMILTGVEIIKDTETSKQVKLMAKEAFASGPAPWSTQEIDKERFFITDVLTDILYPVSRSEQIASAAWLYEALSQFYFRARGKWRASGKSIPRYLETDDPDLAKQFNQAFAGVFENSETSALETLVKNILKPYGGLLWEEYKSDASAECRLKYTKGTP